MKQQAENQTIPPDNRAGRYRMPAEWTAHEVCWMAWPCRLDLWPDLNKARSAYALIANAIIEFEAVNMLVNPEDYAQAQSMLDSRVQLITVGIDDSWTRDSGPTFVYDQADQSGLAAVDWRFNGWGDKFRPWDKDAQMATFIAGKAGAARVESALTLEGGAIHVDGAGSLMTTRQCLLNPNRNPDWTQQMVEAELKRVLGVDNFIWLDRGLVDDHTDGHIDELACFCGPGKIVALTSDDSRDANYPILEANLARLAESRQANGEAWQIVKVPQPEARYLADGSRMSLSYINYYHANGAIIMAAFGQSDYDSEAFRRFKQLYPDREVVQLDATAIFEGGGGIHCITQQQPRVINLS